MSLFAYLDTRAPSTEDILRVETEYDEHGMPVEPSWVDAYELQTEFSLQRLSSLFGSLSIVFTAINLFLSIFFPVKMLVTAYRTGNDTLSYYSLFALIGGLLLTALVFALLRLAKAWVSFMLVRLLQTEEDGDDDDED